MEDRLSRTRLLLGEEGLSRLSSAHVAVFGVGGVGGYAAEALVRCGIGTITLVDSDRVSLSNLNRQIIADHTTLGMLKTEAAAERFRSIAPECRIITRNVFFVPETADSFDFSEYTYIIDAVDTVTAKTELAVRAYECSVPIISAMGAGNKLDPTAFEVTDIYKTSVCPLARVMRHELKKRGIPGLKVVYSKEKPIDPRGGRTEGGKPIPGSVSFVPSVAGLIIGGEVIRDICGIGRSRPL